MTSTVGLQLNPKAIYDQVLPARKPWSKVIEKGQILRIVDLGGNQAVDFLVYNADDPSERYSAPDTIRAQGNVFITSGTKLYSNDGNVLMTGKLGECEGVNCKPLTSDTGLSLPPHIY